MIWKDAGKIGWSAVEAEIIRRWGVPGHDVFAGRLDGSEMRCRCGWVGTHTEFQQHLIEMRKGYQLEDCG
jgi:hypothetical protein